MPVVLVKIRLQRLQAMFSFSRKCVVTTGRYTSAKFSKEVFVKEIKLLMKLKASVCTIMCNGKKQNALFLVVEQLVVWI